MDDWKKCRTLGERVRWAIKVRAGATINGFAKQYGFKQSSLNSLVNGQEKSGKVADIAIAADVNARWLGTGKGTPYLAEDISPEGRAVGRRFDDLTREQRDEVIKHIDWIVARDRPESAPILPTLKATISRLARH